MGAGGQGLLRACGHGLPAVSVTAIISFGVTIVIVMVIVIAESVIAVGVVAIV